MIIEGDFKYFFNGEPYTKERIKEVIDYDTTVSIKGFDVHYFSPKKVEKTVIEGFKRDSIQELLKEADEHQKQNGGILKGVEFPFDAVSNSTRNKFPKYEEGTVCNNFDNDELNHILFSKEQKIIEDWNRADLPLYAETPLGELLKDWCNQLTGEKESKRAYKETEGKLFYELDWGFITQMAERMASNKKESKYDLWNWKKQMTPKGIADLKQATLRHLLAVLDENYEDDGREFGHIEAIADNMMMINYQLKNNQK